MKYVLLILPRAQREIASIDPPDREKIGWRIRVGNYRVIYEIDDQARSVTVLHVGHRREVYR